MAEEQSDSTDDHSKDDVSGKTRIDVLIALIPLIPKAITFLLCTLVLYLFYEPIKSRLSTDLTKVEVFGITAEFDRDQFQQVKRLSSPDSSAVFQSVNQRLKYVHPLIVGGKVLWIDDNHPTQNARERELVRSMGIAIDIVSSSDEALDLVCRTTEFGLMPYDVIVSDVDRDGNVKEGVDFFYKHLGMLGDAKFIMYTDDPELLETPDTHGEVPTFLFGATQFYDELLHLLMDALERRGVVSAAAPYPPLRDQEKPPGTSG